MSNVYKLLHLVAEGLANLLEEHGKDRDAADIRAETDEVFGEEAEDGGDA